MSDVKDQMIVDIKDFNELLKVIASMNQKHDDNHSEFIEQLKTTNNEHEKRYREFYIISQNIFKQLKKSIADHEKRIKKLEKLLNVA
jgi:trehalose/maltose hydrolase-like predicted phosphorylase